MRALFKCFWFMWPWLTHEMEALCYETWSINLFVNMSMFVSQSVSHTYNLRTALSIFLIFDINMMLNTLRILTETNFEMKCCFWERGKPCFVFFLFYFLPLFQNVSILPIFCRPVNVLHMLKKDISIPLSKIFNLSMKTGNHPDCLKLAMVIPIHKKESKLEVG